MRTLSVMAAAFAMLITQAAPVLAADGGLPGATVRSDSAKASPERRAGHEQWCKANPEKCKEMQARREQCKADPEKCRAERQAKMKERQAQCKADPEKCKAEMQARGEERFKKADSNGDGRISREEAEKGMPGRRGTSTRSTANKDAP